ncbi:MAG: hypothetical protein ACJ8DI_09845 [Ktedonobacteraceae bacterium]
MRFIFLQGQPPWVGQPEAASTDDWPLDGGDHEGVLPQWPPESWPTEGRVHPQDVESKVCT